MFNANRKFPSDAAPDAQAAQESALFRVISEGLRDGADEHELAELLRIRSVLAFIRGIEAPVQRLADKVEEKVDSHVLFSDAAVREINDLFRKTRFLVQMCADAVLTENALLKAHVLAGVAHVQRLLKAYQGQHQQRLASGICRPRASVLYLEMGDCFARILHHVREIVQHVVADVEVETWSCPPGAPSATEWSA